MDAKNATRLSCLGKVFSIFLLVCSLIGCAGGGRYIAEPSTPAEIGISGSNDDLHVTLNCLICGNAAGSWVKDAPWHEYILTIKTPPEKSLTIFKVALIDPTGVERLCGAHPGQLEQASENLLKMYKNQGIFDAAVAGGMAASILTAVPFIGPAFNLAGMGFQQGSHYADAKEKEAIQAEFERRRLQIPASLSGKANVRGSVFFPTIPNPKALVMEYRVGKEMGETKTLNMPLEKVQAK